MKSVRSSKVKPAANREEECGVWLDTKELKEKKQQKQLTRPASRFRSPLSGSGLYNVALMSFTQTKLNMPITRQSTISTFFSPKPIDCNPETNSGTKRKHGISLDPSVDSIIHSSEDGDSEETSANDTKHQRFLHFINGEDPEEEQPPEKRRLISYYTDLNIPDTQEYSNQDAGNEYTNQIMPETETENPQNKHFIHSPSLNIEHLRDQKSSFKASILTSRSGNEHKPHANLNKEPKPKASPLKRMGKENSSPINTPSSPFKLKVISSPSKRRLKEKCSSLPSNPCKQESVSSMFTQDSEGFCVIAHRDQRLQSADLQSADYRSSQEEESDAEMLFTQDSEGNMVIKH
ncbi:aurora kinase A and ninein-interacting protein [Danio aesculapii]|uniref:aurora kinase A and ninein-interacting protein n=1 Tax=Danio aesculapii TaxID=1142201 RepID=UPI0024BFA5FD|nr:aurora kinase A and ninein-interacting protein [Danio aesculapii]